MIIFLTDFKNKKFSRFLGVDSHLKMTPLFFGFKQLQEISKFN